MNIRWDRLTGFLRLVRPLYLAGGLLLFGLGTAIAGYAGHRADFRLYALGQVVVACLQVMTHALVEDHGLLSSQSELLVDGKPSPVGPRRLSTRPALQVAIVALATAAVFGCILLIEGRTPLAAWVLLAFLFLGAYLYAAPPVQLSLSGYGEIVASLLLAGLVPAFAFALQARYVSALLILSTAPLVALHLAMLLAFELASYEVDLGRNRRTLMIRLGWRTGLRLHDGAMVFAVGAVLVAWVNGLPGRVALSLLIAAPLALAQVWQVVRIRRGFAPAWRTLTVYAGVLFGLATYLELAGFLLAP
jgi:1,4-dihydroxy-2-naphthoate octaprenyltransferase